MPDGSQHRRNHVRTASHWLAEKHVGALCQRFLSGIQQVGEAAAEASPRDFCHRKLLLADEGRVHEIGCLIVCHEANTLSLSGQVLRQSAERGRLSRTQNPPISTKRTGLSVDSIRDGCEKASVESDAGIKFLRFQ